MKQVNSILVCWVLGVFGCACLSESTLPWSEDCPELGTHHGVSVAVGRCRISIRPVSGAMRVLDLWLCLMKGQVIVLQPASAEEVHSVS